VVWLAERGGLRKKGTPLIQAQGLPVNAEHDAEAEQRIAQQGSASARSRIGSARPDSVVRISRPSWSW
jgi:hypothetical protein